MRVLSVVHAFPPHGVGGTERYAEFAAQGLSARGHQVTVLTGTPEWRAELEVHRERRGDLDVVRLHRNDLYFDHWDKVFNPHVSARFEQLLDEVQPDVMHLHHWIRLSDDLVRRAAARGIPAVLHLHDLFVTCPRVFRILDGDAVCTIPFGEADCLRCVPRWKFQGDPEIERSLANYGAQIDEEFQVARARIAPTRSHAEGLARLGGLAELAFEVLPHPQFDLEGEPALAEASPAGALRLLWFSHVHPVKGLHVLLEAMRELGPGAGIRLDVLGGFTTEDYEARIRALADGLEVVFHGAYQPGDLRSIATDAVVITSLALESWSFWLDEADQLGVPVIIPDHGSIGERATDRHLRYPPRDRVALSERLRALRDDVELRRRLAAAPGAPVSAPADHLHRLESILQGAIAAGVSDVPALPDPTRLAFEWDRREAGFQELLRSEGWEDALRQHGEEIARLRQQLSEAREGE